MNIRIKSEIILTIISCLFGVLIFYAAIYKVLNYSDFYTSLFYYTLIPRKLVEIISFFTIFLEIWLGIGLLIKKFRIHALKLFSVLIIVFIIITATDYSKGVIHTCGCGVTFFSNEIGIIHLLQNITLLLALLFLIHNHNKLKTNSLDAK